MRKLLPVVVLLASGTAQAANARYNPVPTTVVHLQFEGDPSFPSLTFSAPTAGLARFSGANFGLSEQQRGQVITRIKQLVEADYADFNVRFVTEKPASGTVYTWGIDDTSFIFTGEANGCQAANGICRLLGKAGAAGPGATDASGQSIVQPHHARTWGGSFTLPSSSGTPSQPRLVLGGTLPNGATITVDHIAQALANSAAHEIGHLFGLPEGGCSTVTCKNTHLMFAMPEGVEATNDKVFDANEQDILRRTLGTHPRLTTEIAGALRDGAAGLMWTRDARLTATHPTAAVGAAPTLGFADAKAYAASLDFLGYNDWRLPSAQPPTGRPPCTYVTSRDPLPRLILQCGAGEMGRLDAHPFPIVPTLFHFDGGSYWNTILSDDSSWLFNFATGLVSSAAPATAGVWPVRDTATLVDNGDGTITDTARRLMWVKDPGQLGRRTSGSARSLIVDFTFAGRSDWRLPRLDGKEKDATCADPTVLFGGGASAGCRLNELGHLAHGWGISSNGPGPFVMPAGGGPVWFEDLVGGAAPQPVTYFFDGGVLRTDSVPATLGVVFPVRDLLPGEVPRGTNVIVEPIPDVVVRFDRVTSRGAMSATVSTISTFPTGQTRVFTLATSAVFDAATVCLRYPGELNGVTDVRVARKTNNGVLELFVPLPVVAGYPDTLNHVVCGRTSALGEFRVKDPNTFP